MKNLFFLLALLGVFGWTSCCSEYTGYGRYSLLIDCQTVTIDGIPYQLTLAPNGTELAIDGHTITRGIQRKTRPWLYVHSIDMSTNTANITFDEGSKSNYPLYTGSKASIFSPFDHPWDIEYATCIAFANDYWLVAHRWDATGVYFDLQLRNNNDDTDWTLVQADIFVANGGASVNVPEIATDVTVTALDATAKTATVEFSL
ncbi:MAG: hypothetical protein KDC34_07425 [Saprospiraceae bacterium]|nr:hypothetical protein [Saprospiraceae bacterium]